MSHLRNEERLLRRQFKEQTLNMPITHTLEDLYEIEEEERQYGSDENISVT